MERWMKLYRARKEKTIYKNIQKPKKCIIIKGVIISFQILLTGIRPSISPLNGSWDISREVSTILFSFLPLIRDVL
ncbi:MAG: hypothetical protein MZV64_36255 [Ignavibacteriales bacterium]|nr:hypothetical protein [Ignavibacteriales bacterium]